jgi:predicted DNA-binding transcriptional regulator YafY
MRRAAGGWPLVYHPTTRVLAVLALLRAHGRMTGAELARRLEVDTRTLRRYVTMLQDLGVPVMAERGRTGAYVLAPDYRLPPLTFTSDEVLALTVGLMAARGLGLAEITPAVESAQAKIEEAMTPELAERVRALTATLMLDLGKPQTPSSRQTMMTLSSAAQAQQRVQMAYRSTGGKATERDFDPYGLAFRQGKWYVVGYCHLRRELRSFRVDRITHAEITGTHFERPADFDAIQHVVTGIATMPRQYAFEVLLQTDLETAQGEMMQVLGVLEPCDDGLLLRGTADNLDWVAGQLAAFSFGFAVHTPDELRDALRRLAVKLTDVAKS